MPTAKDPIVYSTLYQAFISIYEKNMEPLYDGYAPDQALLRMMQAYPLEFSTALDEYMLYLVDATDGFHIQKRFRSMDVIQDGHGGHIDMCIWYLMCEASIFWEILENIQTHQTLH